MKPPPPNLRDQAIGWALDFCADWEECQDNADFAPEKAWALLAAWGASCRFFGELPEAMTSVAVVLKRDGAALLAALRQAPEPAEWLERARHLNRAWDFALRADTLRELEMAAIDLFDRLDRHSLALCMAWRLDSGTEADDLIKRADQLAQAEDYFVQHVDSFLPATRSASALIAACRPDLPKADPELWLTTRKHRRLEEAWKEAETPDPLQSLTEQDKRALQAKVALKVAPLASRPRQLSKWLSPARPEGEIGRQPSCLGRLHEILQGALEGAKPGLSAAALGASGDLATVQAPERVWKSLQLAANELTWHETPPDNELLTAQGTIEVEWYASGFLEVRTDGLFRRGQGYSLRVDWLTAGGEVRGQAETDPAEPRALLRIRSDDGSGPHPGDRLSLRHLWRPDDGQGWETTAVVEFE